MVKSISAFSPNKKYRRPGERGKNINRLFVIALFVAVSLKSTLCAFAGQDWEYWSKYSFEVAGNDKIGFSLSPEFRFKDSFDNRYYSKTYMGLYCKLNTFVSIKAYYAYKTKKSEGVWKETDLLYLDPTLKFSLPDVDFSTRFRFEYDLDKDELIYRTRLKLGWSVFRDLALFIKEEPFYSFLSDQFTENRFSVGSTVKVWKRARLSGEYMLKSRRSDPDWQSVNVLVSTLSFVF
jgi:hypothetical protein